MESDPPRVIHWKKYAVEFEEPSFLKRCPMLDLIHLNKRVRIGNLRSLCKWSVQITFSRMFITSHCKVSTAQLLRIELETGYLRIDSTRQRCSR